MKTELLRLAEEILTDAFCESGYRRAKASELLRALAAQPAAQDGWVMVPMEPTEGMLSVASTYHFACNQAGLAATHAGMWRAMIAASQEPPR